ncbi:metallophosphoesterase family protein [Oceanobacillus salinisoli]|uniref:metallophosphoesterase n=1 Tax=Oceanobacillus salinisoli TaxID=2678611 RepID=UPI0012E321CB|nr:metallophosphoesterase [Oceanobacillus salinisoli]
MSSALLSKVKQTETKNRQFNEDGKYGIVQYNDIQDDEEVDPRTIELMNTVIQEQNPDLVIINGDMLNADLDTADEVKQAIDTIAKPMEENKVNWAVTQQ